MILSLFGLILLAIPFLLVFRFINRYFGFAFMLGTSIALHSAIAFFTQFFHVFNYSLLITLYSVISLIILYVSVFKSNKISFKIKPSLLVLAAFIIIIFQFWSVHSFYTGAISNFNGHEDVYQSAYPYPYYSDEWIGVAYSNYIIDNNTLPTANPLIDISDNNFPNIFLFFFSLIAELFLILNITPLIGYSLFSMAAWVLVCLLVFVILRTHKVSLWSSSLAILIIPYIANGANLPGVWYLLPCVGGLILFLISLIGLLNNKTWFAVFMAFLSLLLYPPIIAFTLPTIFVYILATKEIKNKNKIKLFLFSLLGVFLAAVSVFLSQINNKDYLIDTLVNGVIRVSLDNGIPSFEIWNIIPIIIMPFIVLGVIKLFKTKNFIILIPLVTGLLFWFFYTFSFLYFIIDYARVVIITSIFLIISLGFGFDYNFNYLLNKYNFDNKKILLLLKIVVISFFIFSSFFYTNNLRWKELKLNINYSGTNFLIAPNPPANHYLKNEDISLFGDFSKERFISPPWKGLVIGVATNNYPMDSKNSIISNTFLNYNEFIEKNCEGKVLDMNWLSIKYVYSEKFSCDNFLLIGESEGGVVLI
ncbi:MAG: hypothetical protein ACOYL8_02700 [Patescibacteria group bacterium]